MPKKPQTPFYPIPFPPAPSLPCLSLAPSACLETCPVLPLKPPNTLCAGTGGLLEIFPLIALACRGWGSPQLQLVQDLPLQHIHLPGEVSWGLKGQANPTELGFPFSPPRRKSCELSIQEVRAHTEIIAGVFPLASCC